MLTRFLELGLLIDMRTALLYRLTFPSGKVYHGITRETLDQRVARHVRYARAGKHFAVSAAIRKYGESSFKADVLATGSWDEMQQAEITAILESRRGGPGCYNMTGGGEGSLGVALTSETKKLISVALTGRSLTDEHRAKVGIAQRGKVIPNETRQRMKASANERCRTPMSDEQREKIRRALAGRKRPPEVIAKISATQRSKTSRPEIQHRPPSPSLSVSVRLCLVG